jgi:Chaperone of endosialidase
MNQLIQSKNFTTFILSAGALVCFGLLPKAQAVVPAPDGGYPNFNTAEGTKALFSLTTGSANTAVGWFSLFSNAEGSFNTATGAGALLFNTADENTAFGVAALLFNTTGTQNTAVGAAALLNNTEGSGNTAVGADALFNNTTNGLNTATGTFALFSNTGDSNTATGYQALTNNTGGGGNTATGRGALINNITGSLNTADGYNALFNNTAGSGNIALGVDAGSNITGAGNIDIGNPGTALDGGVIRIGVQGNQVATFIAGIYNEGVGGNALTVLVDSDGKLGISGSSRRFKRDIQPMDDASEAILALRPVTFHYKSDKTGTPQFGLIAEEVAAMNPDLVVRDKNGEIYTVRYDAVNAMLLNEFLKEHRTVQEQKATIAQLEKGMKTVIARLEEQASQIQKVSARIEVSKAVGQTALNKP